jgi:hypothetical protein
MIVRPCPSCSNTAADTGAVPDLTTSGVVYLFPFLMEFGDA